MKLSLRLKVVLILLAGFVLFATVSGAVQRLLVLPTYARLERDDAIDDLGRCEGVIQAEIGQVAACARDWSLWDDTYDWVQDRNPRYLESNALPVPEKFQVPQMNLIYLVDRTGQVLWGASTENGQVFACPEMDAALASGPRLLFDHPSAESRLTGILSTSRGLLLLASSPIMRGDRKSEVRGAVIMGRFIRPKLVHQWAERTRLNFDVWPANADNIPSEWKSLHNAASDISDPVLREISPTLMHVYGEMPSLMGERGLLMRVEVPRHIATQGRRQSTIAFTTYAIASATILMVVWLLINFIIVRPVRKLTKHARRLGASHDLSARLHMERRDELGELANAFDDMVQSLADSRRQMLNIAHQSGMAQTAIDVIHNIGNALNTINISTTVISENLHASAVQRLQRATALLDENRQDLVALFGQERGRKLAEYISAIGGELLKERDHLLSETALLHEKIEHIREIIAAQQETAAGPRTVNDEDLAEITQRAVRMYADEMYRRGITFQFHCPNAMMVRLNTHTYLQVLGNLLRNAAEAIQQKGGTGNRIAIRLRQETKAIVVEVQDTGVGIAPENLERIFGSGVSTKANGRGVGLHYCANAIRQMGGRIRAASEGPGRGALFVIELPNAPKPEGASTEAEAPEQKPEEHEAAQQPAEEATDGQH